MTEIQKINAAARLAFDTKDYALAFHTLWKSGVFNFVSFAQKEEKRSNKINWFSHSGSADFFWKRFMCEENVFETIFTSDSAAQLLHNYFSKCKIQSLELESRLVKEFPVLFIKAVRINQAFLKPDRIETLSCVQLEDKFLLHRNLWKKIYEIELILWKAVEEELAGISKYTLNEMLSHCIIWLETTRFNNRSQKNVYHLASVYSVFIEIVFNKYPDKISSGDFLKQFIEVFTADQKEKKIIDGSSVSKLLNNLSTWTVFKEQVISPYSFDLNIEPVQEDEQVFFNSTPQAHYKWLLNGVRYEFNHLNYMMRGMSLVEQWELEGEIKIPKGKNPNDENLNRNLAGAKSATLLLLDDLGIKSFEFGNAKIAPIKLLHPLLSYSFNRLNRYEKRLKIHSATSENWEEAFAKLIYESVMTDISREPFFWMTIDDYRKLNQDALSQIPQDSTQEVVQMFSYDPSKQYGINRFHTRYDVWQKPFTKIGEKLFCPMMFFASNIWFYSFAQEALRQYKSKETERGETRTMENNFGEIIQLKGWMVKVINDQEANEMDGDVDIFVEDNETLLFIQLKRTYFRLDLKDAYYDSINTDKKAAKQLNDAEKYLTQSDTIYRVNKKPIKWIVSTSFENIGVEINGCIKVNYFEFLNTLKNPAIIKLKDLIDNIESDGSINEFVYSVCSELHNDVKQIVYETIKPLATVFESKQYRQLIFTEEGKKSEEYSLLFNEAAKLYLEGKKNEALILFQKCVTIKPEDGDAYGSIANILADMKSFDDSFRAFRKALKLLPDDPYISRNYSLALFEAGRFSDGLTLAIQLVEKYPLLGDFKFLFKRHFEECLRRGLLAPKQLLELHAQLGKLG
jgi:tetratricopeptide (TPR) repeat protein